MEVDKTAPDVAGAEVAKPLTPAEARRLRILAKAQERMAAVTGVNWKEPVDAARESSAVAAGGVPTEHSSEQSVADDGPIAAAPAQLRQRHAESSRPAADRASRWAKQYAGTTKASPGSARDPPQALTAGQALRCSAALTALPRALLALYWAYSASCAFASPGPWWALALASLGLVYLVSAVLRQVPAGFLRAVAGPKVAGGGQVAGTGSSGMHGIGCMYTLFTSARIPAPLLASGTRVALH